MISVGITALGGGSVAGPHYVPRKQTIDQKYYTDNMMESDLLVGTHSLAAANPPTGRPGDCKAPFILQEDGATAHTAASTRLRMKALNVACLGGDKDKKIVWPANSPDLSPCDFYFWSALESALRALPAQAKNAQELRPLLKTAIESIPRSQIKAARLSPKKRLGKCLSEEGRPFEFKGKKKRRPADIARGSNEAPPPTQDEE